MLALRDDSRLQKTRVRPAHGRGMDPCLDTDQRRDTDQPRLWLRRSTARLWLRRGYEVAEKSGLGEVFASPTPDVFACGYQGGSDRMGSSGGQERLLAVPGGWQKGSRAEWMKGCTSQRGFDFGVAIGHIVATGDRKTVDVSQRGKDVIFE